MRKILSMLGVATLSIASASSFVKINNTVNNTNANHGIKQKLVRSPKDTLVTAIYSGMGTTVQWSYATINLGSLRQEQIVDIISTNDDSYSDHEVHGHDYYKKDFNGGVNSTNFRKYFSEGRVTDDWDHYKAIGGAYMNFESESFQQLGYNFARGFIKFQWYYNENNDLLIDIVGTLLLTSYNSWFYGKASIKLGTVFTIKYTD